MLGELRELSFTPASHEATLHTVVIMWADAEGELVQEVLRAFVAMQNPFDMSSSLPQFKSLGCMGTGKHTA